MGAAISVFPLPYPDDILNSVIQTQQKVEMTSVSENLKGESPFDKLLMYPVFLSDRRINKKHFNMKKAPIKPIVMYNRTPDKEPMVVELQTVLRNLDIGGELEKNSTVLSSLLVAQYEDSMDYDVTVNYAYGFSSRTGKCYFYKHGNLDHLMSRVDDRYDLRMSNVSSRQIFLAYLHELMNTMTGTVWLNGYCISGPEDPDERIPVKSIDVKSIPGRVTLWVKDLDGIHVIRTKTRLEVHAKMNEVDDLKKAIWFRGPFANSLIVSEVEEHLMSILIPPYCQDIMLASQQQELYK